MLGDHAGALLTAGLSGSFGTLEYAVLAFGPSRPDKPDVPVDNPGHSLTADLLRRGFRLACNDDYADMALKAQPADGSIVCRVATGHVTLVIDNQLVWTRRIKPEEDNDARWIRAARNRDITLIASDHLRVSAAGVDSATAAASRTLVMARIPIKWL